MTADEAYARERTHKIEDVMHHLEMADLGLYRRGGKCPLSEAQGLIDKAHSILLQTMNNGETK